MSYTKLFNSIITSTIWTEDDKTRILWITMLALADKNGEVQASIPGLARVAGMSVGDCEAAITKFLGPDPYSRTPDDDGRRIEVIGGGFALLNHGKYREMASRDEQKEAEAERKRRYRERLARNGNGQDCPEMSQNCPEMSRTCPTMSHDVPKTLHIAEAEAEAEEEGERREELPAPPRQLSEILPTGAARDMLALQARVQGLKKEWRLALTYEEQQAMLKNGACLYSLEDADWARLHAYLAAKVPEGAGYWQPRNRGQFIASLPDVHGHACRWEEKSGNAPKKKSWS